MKLLGFLARNERRMLVIMMVAACILPTLYLAGNKFSAFIWSFNLALYAWLYRRRR